MPNIEVTGILLTSAGAKAIINGKCYGINDTVSGGQIIKIEKGGVTLQVKEETWEFPVSGQAQAKSAKKSTLTGMLDRAKSRIDALKKQAKKKRSRN